MALETVLMTLGFYVADRALGAAVGHFGLATKSDIAGLPLLVLTGGAVSLVLLPLANAVSRAHERRADRYALEMTRKRGRVHQRDEAPRCAEPRRGTALTAGRDPVLLTSSDRRPARDRPGLGVPSYVGRVLPGRA